MLLRLPLFNIMYDGVFGICVPEMAMVVIANHLEDVNLKTICAIKSRSHGTRHVIQITCWSQTQVKEEGLGDALNNYLQ